MMVAVMVLAVTSVGQAQGGGGGGGRGGNRVMAGLAVLVPFCYPSSSFVLLFVSRWKDHGRLTVLAHYRVL